MEEQTQLEKDLHQLRKDIDVNIKTTGKFKITPEMAEDCSEDIIKCQREIALAYTKLQEAKMWAGKCLEAIGSPFPEELRDET